jgi:hypothetical protein
MNEKAIKRNDKKEEPFFYRHFQKWEFKTIIGIKTSSFLDCENSILH